MSNGPLSEPDIDKIFNKALWFLENKGMIIEHDEILNIVHQKGGLVDFEAKLVRFPEKLIRESIESAPEQFSLAAPNPEHDVILPSSPESFYVCTNTGARGIIDPLDGQYRLMAENDIRRIGHLVDQLSHIDVCAVPTATDAPPETVDIHGLRALLESTNKHIWLQPHTEQTLPYLFKLAIARSGGVENFKNRPNVSFMVTSLTPFKLKQMDMEVMLHAARYQAPVHICSVGTTGGTSPITPLGTVMLCFIEILGQLTITQLIQTGTPVLGLVSTLVMDMQTGIARKGNPDVAVMNAASAQLIREICGIPTHINGMTTDSLVSDGQAQIERSLLGSFVAESGADIMGRAGELEGAKTASPAQLVVDNEIAGMLKQIRQPLVLNDDTLCWNDITSVAPGGHFLNQPTTLKYCRDGYRSPLLMSASRDDWVNQGAEDYLTAAQNKARPFWTEKMLPSKTDENIRQEMAEIVNRADKALIN
jgi:trimethylamine---corrinoid protein Co-methyltransferase